MKAIRSWCAASVLLAGVIACGNPAPAAEPNDHRTVAGAAETDGSRRIALEARMSRWYPAADDAPWLDVAAFGEPGRAPTVPGPLIRVGAGTRVTVALTNRLPDTLLVTGLVDPLRDDTLLVAPGASATTSFLASTPGLFGYVGTTRRDTIVRGGGLGGQLSGVIAVDTAGAPPDRIFAITSWSGPIVPATGDSSFLIAVNGRMWPRSERLTLAVGDSVFWRLINFAQSFHPMHLHGAYFRVDSRGTWRSDTAYTTDQRRLVVTETLRLRETMSLSWSPERPGHWLFHCHDAFHVHGSQASDLPAVAPIWAAEVAGRPAPAPAPMAPAAHDSTTTMHGMAGLVLGIEVSGPAPDSVWTTARRIDLAVQQQARRFGEDPGIGFVQARPGSVPADSLTIPGAPLVLERGVPTAITVHNRLSETTSIHWHGLELESYYDGVSGWSGNASRLAPAIAPGDSFVARMAPPRAGTFIYHSHFGEVRQLSLGLFGPLIVLEPGQRWDPDRDRVVMFSVAGLGDSALVVAHHPAAPLRAGVTHRLRFINITPADDVFAELLQDGAVVPWQIVAKDGADLPAPQNGPARLQFGPGETIDIEFTPRRGPVTMRVRSFNDFESVFPVR